MPKKNIRKNWSEPLTEKARKQPRAVVRCRPRDCCNRLHHTSTSRWMNRHDDDFASRKFEINHQQKWIDFERNDSTLEMIWEEGEWNIELSKWASWRLKSLLHAYFIGMVMSRLLKICQKFIFFMSLRVKLLYCVAIHLWMVGHHDMGYSHHILVIYSSTFFFMSEIYIIF